ncbi:MAG: multidrug efflux SMR transporter [Amaricoccus sp.]|uniref:DMT family transporter n=1 Tax=Amaricoccus sp. TaxID=1872485 RepID=UPI0039E55005
MTLSTGYFLLLLAIVCEVTGTTALAASAQLTRPGPAAVALACYGVALALQSHVYRVIPVGVVYALWSGIGMVLVVGSGWLVFGQRLGPAALVGIALILAGVLVLHLAPNTRLP